MVAYPGLRTVVFGLFFVASPMWSLGNESSDLAFDLTIQKDLQTFGRVSEARVLVDAGNLPAGKRGRLNIILRNQLDCDWTVDKINTRCQCSSARLDDNKIPRGDSATLQLIIETPPKSATGRFRTDLTLMATSVGGEHDKMSALILIEFGLEGMVAFKQPLHAFEVLGDQDVELTVPFVSTLKDGNANLKLALDDRFLGIDAKLAGSKDSTAIVLNIDPAILPKAGVYGVARLEDRSTGVSDEATIIITRRQMVSVSPNTLRFVKDGDGYSAKAIMKLHPSVFPYEEKAAATSNADATPQAKQTTESPPVFMEAIVAGNKVKIQQTQLTSLVYRLDLKLPANFISLPASENGSLQIDWTVIAGRSKEVIASPLALLDEQQ